MKFKVLTLFPEMINHLYEYGVIGKALEKKIIELVKKQLEERDNNESNSVAGC